MVASLYVDEDEPSGGVGLHEVPTVVCDLACLKVFCVEGNTQCHCCLMS